MCTVTYIPSVRDNSFVLTSNRDEKTYRSTQPPACYQHGGRKVIYPKDEKAGGSWIAINENGKIACLLNGAFAPHNKQDYHSISRGSVLVDYTASEKNSHEYFSGKELLMVEPFTIVSIMYKNNAVQDFTEFIWDGKSKHFRQLNVNSPYIWSSVTLYNHEHRNMRKGWFVKFYKEKKDYMTPEKILGFHSGRHTSDGSVNVIMQREDGLRTVSITQITTDDGQLKMQYTDLVQHSLQEAFV
jgi:hypothetical protein